ncbi:MAG: class I SAM-dependent DNA methyltransferase [candidate division WOR-3 bacterium]
MARKQTRKPAGNSANLGFEAQLWQAADKLRGVMDAAEYKHVVLGLLFLKFISDAFQERFDFLARETADPQSEWFAKDEIQRQETLEDPDSYTMENVFYVPAEARWPYLQAHARDPKIGQLLDSAMDAVERKNPRLKGVLPKIYGREQLDKTTLGGLIDLFAGIGLGDKESRAKDLLGRAYEYFLQQFASAEGKKAGEFYTPRCVVRLLVAMLEPFKGRVYDPCCGSGGMFVQSEEFVKAHGGRIGDISIYGQERNQTTWRLCMMNLAIRGIEGRIAWNSEGSFHNDAFPDLKADFILANPPFNDKAWGGERLRDDKRWKFGVPPARNANFAWVQHFIHHLAPTGMAGFVLANGSLSSNQSGEGEIRKNIIEADLVDCIVALPGQLFYSTQIPACLWFIARDKKNGKFRDRRGETLFVDARKLGTMVDRVHRELTDDDIQRIAGTYHAWRGRGQTYSDIPGFCKSATLGEIRKHGHVLTPGRYVGVEPQPEDTEPFEEKMKRLTAELERQFAESERLEAEIRKNLKGLGYEG